MIKYSNRAKSPTQYLPLQLIVRCFLSFFCPIDQTRSYHNFPSNSFIPKTRKCSTNPISTQIISPCINCSVGCYNSWWRILCLYSSLYIPKEEALSMLLFIKQTLLRTSPCLSIFNIFQVNPPNVKYRLCCALKHKYSPELYCLS